MKTKERIFNKALDLFNVDGLEKVTTRHIAKALEISQGNLHYHYPNKNEIISTLFDHFMTNVENASSYDPNQVFTKEEVLKSTKRNFEIMFTYRFLFIDQELVWRRLPKIKEKMIQFFGQKKIEIKNIITSYQDQNIFRKEISIDQISYLTEQFIFSITTWLTASEYTTDTKYNTDYYSKFVFRHWLPYLTSKEMKKWEAIL